MLQLKESGLRYGDSCALITPARPRRRICLNRTKMDIVPEGDHSSGGIPIIGVPGAPSRSFRWRLELVPVNGEARYLLRSIDGTPFALNGQWGREVFLEGFDTLGLSIPGRLEFQREDPAQLVRYPTWPEALRDTRVMESSLPVLLQGETGTGKSHLAREIHQRSGRTGEFVALNVSALAPGLVESELFGHKKGAFTGAVSDRKGALAVANGGTLFLDEIDSLSKEMQIKLLLFLDQGCFRRVGDSREEKTSARLIFASGRRLDHLVTTGEVRADFFFRLSQGVLAELKPLRERPELIERHCQVFAIEHSVVIGPRLLDFYKTLPWPGNLRQLRGHLTAKKIRSRTRKLDFDEWDERLLTMTSDLKGIARELDRVVPMDWVKRDYARKAFQLFQGDYSVTARQLGVSQKTLRVWLAA